VLFALSGSPIVGLIFQVAFAYFAILEIAGIPTNKMDSSTNAE